MSGFLIGVVGLLVLIVCGVFYCAVTLWAIKDEMFMAEIQDGQEVVE